MPPLSRSFSDDAQRVAGGPPSLFHGGLKRPSRGQTSCRLSAPTAVALAAATVLLLVFSSLLSPNTEELFSFVNKKGSA